jgi:hypothetical protein
LPKLQARSEEISFEERINHAKLIRALLVAINQQWLFESQRDCEAVSPISPEDSDESDLETSHEVTMSSVHI